MSTDFQTLYDSGRVLRCHVKQVLKHQNVADHTWGLLLILMEIEPTARPELVKYCLYHDVGEVITGDLPHKVKRSYPKLNEIIEEIEDEFRVSQGIQQELTDYEVKVFKWCDMFEFMLYCEREIKLGNRSLVRSYRYAGEYCDNLDLHNLRAQQLMEECYDDSI